MQRRLVVTASSLLLTLAFSLEARPESWVEVKTPAFTVVSDGSEKEARKVAAQFEQIRALLKGGWPWARFETPRPVTILAVRSEKGLKQLLPGIWERRGGVRPAGVFVRAPERNWVALRMDVSRFRYNKGWFNPYLVVFHEYMHLVLDLNFGELPLWFNEGLAGFWGDTIIEDDYYSIGRFISHHLLTLRQRDLLPLATLFAVTQDSPEYSEDNRATIFHAQSWALVHYLALGSKGRKGQLNRFSQLLYDRRPAEEAASEVFGDLAALERELRGYVRKASFPYGRGPATVRADARDFTVRELSEAESLAIRAGFHVATSRPAEARALAEQALALESNLAAAHEALGLMAWHEGKSSEATQALGRATALPGASDCAHYLSGHLRWQQATNPEGLEAVEASFRKAVELNPSFAAAYSSLAQVMEARGAPLERTLPLAQRAVNIEPGTIEYQITVLRLAGRGGLLGKARAEAEALRSRVSGPDRTKVEQLIEDLSNLPSSSAVTEPKRPASDE